MMAYIFCGTLLAARAATPHLPGPRPPPPLPAPRPPPSVGAADCFVFSLLLGAGVATYPPPNTGASPVGPPTTAGLCGGQPLPFRCRLRPVPPPPRRQPLVRRPRHDYHCRSAQRPAFYVRLFCWRPVTPPPCHKPLVPLPPPRPPPPVGAVTSAFCWRLPVVGGPTPTPSTDDGCALATTTTASQRGGVILFSCGSDGRCRHPLAANNECLRPRPNHYLQSARRPMSLPWMALVRAVALCRSGSSTALTSVTSYGGL